MRANRHQSTSQPVMATALLAVAFVAIAARERASNERFGERLAQAKPMHTPRLTNQVIPWPRRLVQAIDRQIIRHFHCALPSGLEPEDFDLSNLTHR